MQVILTHEQADFDAIGALLGAALLFPEACPLLPHRTNRNVRSFLNLYLPDLPFKESQDLPKEKVDRVILVDTQSLVTVKGLTLKPSVQVFDHHDIRFDLPTDWQITTEKTGATTTIFLERLIEHDSVLTPIQSTLMLLGIYEDTGSLTYAGTTARDVRAVAYLLDHGANLQLATTFLNPPLSNEQRALYEELLQNVESHIVNGHSLIIASATAEKLQDEVSSIAHKLRDFLEPEGLFLIIQTSEGIRMVARSTSDNVNVARILSNFHGGGHERAASALLQNEDISDVEHRLIQLLQSEIRSAITASQLMSTKPTLISPDATIATAHQKMIRLGYEGFPVVKNKKVIGLLTRRAVDRAQMHKLNLPVSKLMEAGNIAVHPEDPLDLVQQRMSESGWGQIPVVDPATEEVLGIITRTDILRQITPRNYISSRRKNYSQQLKNALLPARHAFLMTVAKKAAEFQMPIFIVGGFVRDMLLNIPESDFDIVVEGDAIALGAKLSDEYSGKVISHGRFGTAKWQIGPIRDQLIKKLQTTDNLNSSDLPESLDLVSARTEFYDHPTALPTIEKGSIKLDLHRRDFTINTLALRLDEPHHGELYDFWDGATDLKKGLIRVLHALSFIDDPTRILRAIRFEQRFQFQIEPRTLELLESSRDLLSQVSGSRLRHEFDLIMQEKDPGRILERASNLEIFGYIHENLAWKKEWGESLNSALHEPLPVNWNLPDHFGSLPIKTALAYLVWFTEFSVGKSIRIANHLRFSASFIETLKNVCDVKPILETVVEFSPSAIAQRLQKSSDVGLAALYFLSNSHETRSIIQTYQAKWKNLKIYTDGKKLQSLGIPVGPKYRKLLQALRDAWLDGKISSLSEEEAYLQILITT